jgi:hypothetical protein
VTFGEAGEMLVRCACGGTMWAGEKRCPRCVRGPLPDDDALEAAFNRGLLQDEIRRKAPTAAMAMRPEVRTGGTGSPSPRRSNGR